MTDYELLKVAQLRALCKARGLNSEGRKDELIADLTRFDAGFQQRTAQDTLAGPSLNALEQEPFPSSEELKELATISDEMRHLRRQWILQQPRQAQTMMYGSSTVRK